MTENTFLKGKILPPLIKFAFPLMLSQLLQALYGAVDLIVVGHYATTADFSAVSTGSQLMQGITGIIIGLTTGVTVLIGQAVGAGDNNRRRRGFRRNDKAAFSNIGFVFGGAAAFGAAGSFAYENTCRGRCSCCRLCKNLRCWNTVHFGIQCNKRTVQGRGKL